MVVCSKCYDGAPDSARQAIGHGRTEPLAWLDWAVENDELMDLQSTEPNVGPEDDVLLRDDEGAI